MPRNEKISATCPGCNHPKARPLDRAGVFECLACGAIHGRCYLGESYRWVLPHMAASTSPEQQARLKYYDFVTLGSNGVSRRHGWYDPATKLIHQVG